MTRHLLPRPFPWLPDLLRDDREATLLADLSAEVFSLDLSDPSTHASARALLAGRLSVLRAMGSPVVGGAR